MLALVQPRRRRRPSLTPMIDVVFLLLVFFMLAARFGVEGALELTLAPGSDEGEVWQGPPRLVEVRPDGVALNGVAMADVALAGALAPLTAQPSDPVLVRAAEGAMLQRIVSVVEALSRAGFGRLVLVE